MEGEPGKKTSPAARVRLGLCCQFVKEPIKFRTTTATGMMRLRRRDQLRRLAELGSINADELMASLKYCAQKGIGAFRVNSQILPLKTHPTAGYLVKELPCAEQIMARFRDCGAFAREHDIRLSFHPDQFVVLNSPNPVTLSRSISELEYQAEVASWIGADTINIHGGGAYGDKSSALKRLERTIKKLPRAIRSRLTLENDDKIFTPADLLPVCLETGVPLVYDVHHHRCLPDDWNVETATESACSTWKREPVFHISSPLKGWRGLAPERHHDYINPRDFPEAWRKLSVTVEVEAKAKELAVLRLMRQLETEH